MRPRPALLSIALPAALACFSSPAEAADPPPPPPPQAAPPAQQPPPPGYGQPPPPGYGQPPPPGYGQPPPPGYGQPPPPGYGQQPYPPGYPPPYYYPYPPQSAPPPPSGPRVLPYKEGEPPPEGYYVGTESRRGLTIAGVAVFGGAYALSVIGALSALTDSRGDGGYEPLFIPVVGPFITMGTAEDTQLGGDGLGALFLLDGLAQTAGAVMFIVGMASGEKKVFKRIDVSSALPAPEVLVGPGSASLRWQF